MTFEYMFPHDLIISQGYDPRVGELFPRGFNDKLAVWIHNAFYILMLLIGISGIATMIVGGYGDALQTGDLSLIKPSEDLPSLKAHGIMSFLTMGLVALHVIGVVKHYILTKENTLKRIF